MRVNSFDPPIEERLVRRREASLSRQGQAAQMLYTGTHLRYQRVLS